MVWSLCQLAFTCLLVPYAVSFRSTMPSVVCRGPCTKDPLQMTAYDGYALLFDCDGVIVETEEMHRVAYNAAFARFGLRIPSSGEEVVWSKSYYDILQNTVGGGKPKMKHHFNNVAKEWPKPNDREVPSTDEEKTALVDDLQDAKVEHYKTLIGSGAATCRPGIKELMDEAILDPNLKVGICTAATKGGFLPLVHALLGEDRLNKLDVLIVGDDVERKKPDPLIYNTARERLGLTSDKCIVIEDSMVGLRAAKGAGMRCIITYTDSTQGEDFYGEGADAKLLNMNGIKLNDVFQPLLAGSHELLEKFRD